MEYDIETRAVATHFALLENPDEDCNAELDVESYLERACRFVESTRKLLSWLDSLSEESTEEEIQYVYYEIGKEFYGTDKDSLRLYFRDCYMLLFSREAAGRIGILTKVMGLRYFTNKFRERLNDPLRIRELT